MRQKNIEWKVLLILAVISLGLTFFLNGQDQTSADIPQKITREQALQKASTWLTSQQGISVSDMIHTVQLENDPNMEGYLQIEHLHKQFIASYPNARSTVFWKVVFFTPGSSNRYSVDIDAASGTVVGYGLLPPAFAGWIPTHSSDVNGGAGLSIAAKTAALTPEAAQNAAIQALVKTGHPSESLQVRGVTPIRTSSSLLALLDDETGTAITSLQKTASIKAGRSSFYAVAVQDLNWKLQAGTPNLLQYEVLVGTPAAGDGNLLPQVIGVHSNFVVPGSAIRSLQHQRTLAKYLTGIYAVGTFLFAVFGLVVMFRYNRSKLRFSRGWLFVLASCAVLLVDQLNSWPTVLEQLSAAGFLGGMQKIPSTLLFYSAFFIVSALLTGASFYISVVAGSAMSDDLWPGKWMKRNQQGWQERIWEAARRGYLLAVIWMALEGIFYTLFNKYLGGWSETDVSQAPWNLAIPGLFPLLAWVAGTQEEAVYRLFGISLLKRYFPRNIGIALVLPAMIWALGHSLYPVFPFYTRFIELTLFGVLIGYCYLRWNFETVVFAHATYDSILMSISLWDGGTADKIWGSFFLVLPLLIGFYAHLIRGRHPDSQVSMR